MSAMRWGTTPISKLCLDVIDCVNKTAPTVPGPTEYKMLRTSNVRSGWVDTTQAKYVERDVYLKWVRRGAPRAGDVLLTREAPLGQVGILRGDENVFLGQRLVMYRADPAKADNRFLLYALMSPWVQAEIRSLGSGSTVEHMRVPDCESLKIPKPPLPKQRLIGRALGAFDDLIANNCRQIEILEEIARLTYREWFVHFRFPGHEHVRLVDSELGLIPKGWAVSEFSSLVSESKTSVVHTEIPRGSAVVDLEHLPRRSTTLMDWGTALDAGSRRKVFEPGDILFGKIRPYFHKVVDAPISGYASTDTIVFRPGVHPERALCVASSDEFVALAVATSNGTKMPRANSEVLLRFQIAQPPAEIAEEFESILVPLSKLRHNLAMQSRSLRGARDLVLPQFISGEIDVSDLDFDTVAM